MSPSLEGPSIGCYFRRRSPETRRPPLDWTLITIVTLAFLLGGGVKGVIGMGLPMTSIAIMGSVLDLRQAIPIAVIPVIIFNLYQAVQGVGAWDTFKRLFVLNAAACAGIWVGTRILFTVDPGILSLMLGVLLCVYVLVNSTAYEFHVPPRAEPWLGPPLGLAGGIMLGAVGSLVVPVVMFVQALRMDKDAFIQALGMVFFVTAIAWVWSLWQQGAITWQSSQYSLLALIPGTVGMTAGTILSRYVSQERFRVAIYMALFVLGLNLIRKGLFSAAIVG